MNGVKGGGGGGGRRKVGGAPSPSPGNRNKQRDEDLVLFREMHKREKDRIVSLLQPVSDEFDPTGNYALYRMGSAKKGPAVELFSENEKNDYDWLKTPPATPLFPSLEMETNGPEMVVHRELPILQNLSRFAGNSEAAKKTKSTNIGRTKSANPKTKVPLRSVTPCSKPIIVTPILTDQKKSSKSAPILNQKTNHLITTNTTTTTTTADPQNKSSNAASTATCLTKPAISNFDSLKPKATTSIPGFTDETPPNLKTDRSSSVLRGRSSSTTRGRGSDRSSSTIKSRPDSTLRGRSDNRSDSTLRGRIGTQSQPDPVVEKSGDPTIKASRRQSCSPSVTRGRKLASNKQDGEETVTTPKGKFQTGNAGQVFGSRMVDKFLNARKSSAEERENAKPRLHGSINEASGFGRLMAAKLMDGRREQTNSRQIASRR